MDLCVAIGDMLGGDDMEPSMPGYKTKIYFSLANLSFLTLICRPPNTKYKMEQEKYFSTLTIVYLARGNWEAERIILPLKMEETETELYAKGRGSIEGKLLTSAERS